MSLNRPVVIALLLVLLLSGLLLRRCQPGAPGEVSRSRLIMGTVVQITALGAAERELEAAVAAAFAEMERIENLMSVQRPQSDVARLSAPVAALEVAPETAAVIALGLKVAVASGGAFDLTLGALKGAWGLDSDQPQVPTVEAIEQALAGTGPDALRLEGQTVYKSRPLLQVDLGGIAKGYAVDRATEVLRAAGVPSAAINAGGDIRLLGDHQGRPWRIAVQHPRHPEGALAFLTLEEVAVVTSGDYERYFEADGKRYHHLFDPRSGFPSSRCQSVTVVAPSAALADALATAAFVLGPEEGEALLARFPGVEGILVDAAGVPQVSAGLAGRVAWP